MPINPLGRPATTVPPTSPQGSAAATTSTPAATPANAGWTAGATTPAQPSRLEQATTKLKGKAVELALDKAAEEHSVGQNLSLGSFSGNFKLSEEIGLKGSDSFTKLVAGDRRRNEYAQANPDAVWVATKAAAGISAGFPAGAGVSLGFSGGVEVTSLQAQNVKGASDVVGAVKSQAKGMVLPLDAEGLQGLNAAPGSEWMFRGTTGASVGVGVGTAQTVGTDLASATVNVGANLGASASATFTKNVKMLGDNKVFVQVAQVTSESASLSLGVNAAISINASSAVPGLGGKALDKVGDQAEKYTRVAASANASAGATQKVLGSAVVDLSTPAGREQYNYLIRSSPTAAAEFIKTSNLGTRYDETALNRNSGINLQLGQANLLATSTLRGTTNGTVLDGGGTTQLSEATFGRSVGGFLPRLTLGEERNVSVRAGAVTKDGATMNAVAVAMQVKDPKMTGGEVAQLGRFAQAMGTPLNGLPQAAAGDSLGKGDYQVQVAMTDEGVRKLGTWSEADLRLGFASAQKEIDGGAALPPSFSEPQAFAWYKNEYQSSTTSGDGGDDQKMRAAAGYREKYGRDLAVDIESADNVDRMVGAVLDRAGKPANEWGPVLEALGKSQSVDVRAATLALHRLAGAEVTLMHVGVGGKSFDAQARGAAPKTMAEQVGPMLAPPA